MKQRIDLADRIYDHCRAIRERRPLIHVVTNFVVMNQTANALLALGAAPTMSWAEEDLEYLSGISDGLCINMGTPTRERVAAMERLMALAAASDKPMVLDPVGAGAGPHRTRIASRLAALGPGKIIRGNASEICTLMESGSGPRGVDSTMDREAARNILITHGRAGEKKESLGLSGSTSNMAGLLDMRATALLVSGEEDMVMDKSRMMSLRNGSPLMDAVTGTGCILSALTAAFYAVCPSPFEAAVSAAAAAGVAGELAGEKASGPGTFLSHFMDALYTLDRETLQKRLDAEIAPTDSSIWITDPVTE